MVVESPLSTIARPAGFWLLFRRRRRFRGPAFGTQPQRDQGQRPELSVIADILIPLEAFERRHRVGSPSPVDRTRVVTLSGERLLDLLIALGCGLSLGGSPVAGWSLLRTGRFLTGRCSLLPGCALHRRSP